MNKTINQLPNAAAVSTDELEKQVTAGGASQKMTVAQLLTFIQNNATAFAQAISFSQKIQAAGGIFWQISAANGSVSFDAGGITSDGAGVLSAGSLNIGAGNLTIGPTGNLLGASDIEVTNNPSGFIIKSVGGIRYRIVVDNAGNLGTVPA